MREYAAFETSILCSCGVEFPACVHKYLCSSIRSSNIYDCNYGIEYLEHKEISPMTAIIYSRHKEELE